MKEAQTPSPKDLKQRKALVLLLAAVPVLLGLIFAGILVSRALYKPSIGFLDVPDNVRQAIEETLLHTDVASTKLKITILDPSINVEDANRAFRKMDILFTKTGIFSELLQPVKEPDPMQLSVIPTTIRKTGNSGKQQYSTPILLDHFELAWNKNNLADITGIENPSLQHIVFSNPDVSTKPYRWPLLIAGGDDRIFLGFIGAITESLYGIERWNRIKNLAVTLEPDELVKNEEFQEILSSLASWKKQKILHPEWFRMKQQDILQFMESGNTLFIGMFLSDHRNVPQNLIVQYKSSFFPGVHENTNRSLTIPAYIACIPEGKKNSVFSKQIMDSLLTNENQTFLAERSGLAPTTAQSPAPDLQASDVRFWAASAASNIPSFETVLYYSKEKKQLICMLIRQFLESN